MEKVKERLINFTALLNSGVGFVSFLVLSIFYIRARTNEEICIIKEGLFQNQRFCKVEPNAIIMRFGDTPFWELFLAVFLILVFIGTVVNLYRGFLMTEKYDEK